MISFLVSTSILFLIVLNFSRSIYRWSIFLRVVGPVLISLFSQQFEAPKLALLDKMSTYYSEIHTSRSFFMCTVVKLCVVQRLRGHSWVWPSRICLHLTLRLIEHVIRSRGIVTYIVQIIL